MLSGANQTEMPGSKQRGESKPEFSPFLKERYRYIFAYMEYMPPLTTITGLKSLSKVQPGNDKAGSSQDFQQNLI